MAKPLANPDSLRNGNSGGFHGRVTDAKVAPPPQDIDLLEQDLEQGGSANGVDLRLVDHQRVGEVDEPEELEQLRSENGQLRALCTELEQALQEASQQGQVFDERVKEYEQLLEEKSEMIRQLHQKLQDLEGAPPQRPVRTGPVPREDELLNLSEDLERERLQLQEDEQALMEQMRQMEVSMARERAEMARQRNDLQRLQGEIRHELERLERNGTLQSKIEGLKNKLQDATSRRGAAPITPSKVPSQAPTPAAAQPNKKEGGLMGRWFGQGGK
jgi:hypothetical protein